jgi:hypothetical protein
MDALELAQRARIAELAAEDTAREALVARYGAVYSTDEMRAAFEPVGFMAPFMVAKRRSDGVVGSLEFAGSPRFYFNFVADTK